MDVNFWEGHDELRKLVAMRMAENEWKMKSAIFRRKWRAAVAERKRLGLAS